MWLLKKVYFFLLDIAQTLILALAVFIIIYMFLFRPFEVKGESMYPTLKNNQYLITNVITLRLANPKIGDVVVFKAPNEPEKAFIKRVIGLPGDSISLKEGQVYLNERRLNEEKYLDPSIKTYGGSFIKNGEAVTVPSGYYFVLGDNRSYSSDSREWGFVPKKNIVGTTFFVYWPLPSAGILKKPY